MQSNRGGVRPAAVAGYFYPDDPLRLQDDVTTLLTRARQRARPHVAPIGLIAPHAGYIYSGSVAADAYVQLERRDHIPRRVVLIGPSHRVYFKGVAAPTHAAFATPLGDVAIDEPLREQVIQSGFVVQADEPHSLEHSLEVHLPFLQVLLGEFTLLPLVVGVASPEHVASALRLVWKDANTTVIASSDLSHYLTYEEAQAADAQTSDQIKQRLPTLTGEQACGSMPINGLLALAREKDLKLTEITRLNSGDTAGDKDRVVGYGAYAIH